VAFLLPIKCELEGEEVNINDCSIRKVVCISNEDNDFFSCDKNSPLLEVGKTYTIESVNVHGWHTEIELKEFPNTLFNSVCFDEIDNAEHCVCCGQVIPEGRQVCIICGKKVDTKVKADVVEVVRCKDCEHYHKGKDSSICDYDYCDILYYCDGSHRTACEEDFCSYGERKEK
jgi:hypothetical protein